MHRKKSSLVRTVKHIIIASNLFRQFHPESLFFSLQSIVYQHLIDLVHFVSSVTVRYSRVKRYFASLMLFYPIVDWAKNQPFLPCIPWQLKNVMISFLLKLSPSGTLIQEHLLWMSTLCDWIFFSELFLLASAPGILS